MPLDLQAPRRRAELLSGLPADAVLTTEEVAAAIGRSISTVYKWASRNTPDGLLPNVKRGNRAYYRVSDVRRYLGIGNGAEGS